MTACLDAPAALTLVRLPGDTGPTLRCSGELTVQTVEALRRELDLLAPLLHPVLTLNLSACRRIDAEGIVTLLDTARRLQQGGRRLMLVTGDAPPLRVLRELAIDWLIPTFPDERSAAQALRGGGPLPPGPGSWAAARADSLAFWRRLEAATASAPAEDLLRTATSPHGLCRHAERALPTARRQDGTRCHICPLFEALGGRREDLGCRSIEDPLMMALNAGDRLSAVAQIRRVIRLIEDMPLPPE